MQFRFALLQVLLGASLIIGAFSGRFDIRGFDYLPKTPAYRIVFFVLGVVSFVSGLYSFSHLHS